MDIYTLRTKAGTIRKLAEAMEVHPSTVQDWLRAGRMPGNRAIQAGKRFSLSLQDVEDLARKPQREPAP